MTWTKTGVSAEIWSVRKFPISTQKDPSVGMSCLQ